MTSLLKDFKLFNLITIKDNISCHLNNARLKKKKRKVVQSGSCEKPQICQWMGYFFIYSLALCSNQQRYRIDINRFCAGQYYYLLALVQMTAANCRLVCNAVTRSSSCEWAQAQILAKRSLLTLEYFKVDLTYSKSLFIYSFIYLFIYLIWFRVFFEGAQYQFICNL